MFVAIGFLADSIILGFTKVDDQFLSIIVFFSENNSFQTFLLYVISNISS